MSIITTARRALLLGALAAPAVVHAQGAWPQRPVRVIIPWPPGGGADTVGRILFARVAEILGQNFIIENRPGATGTIGANAAVRSAADGYTLLYDATGLSINPFLMPHIPFDVRRDLVPVFLSAVVPNLLVVTPSVQVRTVQDVIALARNTPGGLNWAFSGNGSAQHMALELFRQMTQLPLTHVPYRGGGPALTDVIGGQINFFFSNASASTGHVQSGALRAVGHSGAGRLASLPDVPAVAETLPGFEAYEWNGAFVPRGTPAEVVQRLNAAMNEAIAHPAVAERLAGLNVGTRRNTPDEFRAFLEAELSKWERVIREGNIRLD
ncbi:tripartite tricarboxylate transporter substrate binding protein [Roseococcus suduntuyensis]|uniref:Tripartite-type tricarboxylate transporter receptor subunit TctC n=1 Tax=Roseococcus suduntuyensis TaxID=455361 RepID=A0A840ACT1_9PROT|nr:tripartite tricarboxylate transporter substrate binding protein [Roseococcus suduntuyensis]MBB3898732.1 tripartite-type tricarboxylate transporter receptor subunit TctC [Roseococcus suduntuyensis]